MMQHRMHAVLRMLLALPGAALLGVCASAALAVTPTVAIPNSVQAISPAIPAGLRARSFAMEPVLALAPQPAASAAKAPISAPWMPGSSAVGTGTATVNQITTHVLDATAIRTAKTAGAGMGIAAGPGVLQGGRLGSASPFNFAPAEKITQEAAFEPGQVLVLWTTDAAAASGLSTLQRRYQLRSRQRYILANLGFTVALYALPSDQEARALRERLHAEQPDWTVDLNARSVPLQTAAIPGEAAPRLYAKKMLGGTALKKPELLSLRLGVIDTGLDPALTQAAVLNGSVIKMRSVLGPTDKAADTAHGNTVLQLMVGAAQGNGFAGSAPPVQLAWVSALRELNGKSSTNSFVLVLALDWLLEQKVSLINMSLGGQGDAILKAVVTRVLEKNVVIMAAVGNAADSDVSLTYPAAYPGVWAVTAVDAAGKLYSQASRASYATLAAPGVELWVPGNGGEGAYVSGTSYATALASAALAWQPPGFWVLPAAQQRSQVCAQARKLGGSALLGCGLVQIIANETMR